MTEPIFKALSFEEFYAGQEQVRAKNENVTYLSNDLLDKNLSLLVKQEKELLSEILWHIAEVDKRKLYLKMGYANLFTYLTERMGYAKGPAQRRIDAVRLSREVPSLIKDIEKGEVNLSQVSVLQKAIREKAHELKEASFSEAAKAKKPIRAEEKMKLVEEIKNKSVEETQKIVSKELHIQIKSPPKVSFHSENRVRWELDISESLWEKLLKARELLSNKIPNGDWELVLEEMVDGMIDSKTVKTSKALAKNREGVIHSKLEASDASSQEEMKAVNETKSLSWETLKEVVLARDQCCQYRAKGPNKTCGSRWNLQPDHIKPRWAGGEDSLENLRAMCGNHNRFVYQEQAGIRIV